MKHPAKKQRYDYTLLVVVLLLVGIGLILLYSTSAYNGRVKFHDSFYYLKKQGFATALGLAGMFIVAGIDYHRWIPFAKLGYVTAIVLCVAVMFIGDEYNGSKRWLSLGPISFQPSEFAKVAVIYLRVSTFRSLASFRRDQIPLPNLGFSLAGFTRSIFPVSRKARLCGTFKGVRHSFHHRPSPAVSLRCLDLSFHPAQTLHPSQNVRAWTFL